jgi:hypothetical protein
VVTVREKKSHLGCRWYGSLHSRSSHSPDQSDSCATPGSRKRWNVI